MVDVDLFLDTRQRDVREAKRHDLTLREKREKREAEARGHCTQVGVGC
jgi:hypothetical protein